MADRDTFSEIKTIIVDLLGSEEDKIALEARFREDLEADSLDTGVCGFASLAHRLSTRHDR